MNIRIGFIGGGNMAQAIITGLLAAGTQANEIIVSDPNAACRDALAALGVMVGDDSAPVLAHADLIVLAVKPQIMRSVLQGLAPHVRQDHVFCSIAAGISIAMIQSELALTTQPVVRVMPNTPALLGLGMSALVTRDTLSDATRQRVTSVFEACGCALWVDSEEDIDTVTAVSGSGPAYFFLMIEHLMRSATRLGLPPSVASQLVVQTAKGAAAMVEKADVGPDVLRQRVTSPGGTTEAALAVFAEGDFADLVDRALIAARDRASALSKDAG